MSTNAPTDVPNPANTLPPDEVLFGRSEAMAIVRRRASKTSQTSVPVLLSGDAGTGKETIARWIHVHSRNAAGAFIKVNCAAIPNNLLESELFGYEKGAFTGATRTKPGRVELAHNGTLFLDEITDLATSLQSKLLQFLQDGRFSRIGAEAETIVETRLICASNKNLETEIGDGRFRADLFYRISVIEIHLPRLQQRAEDIPVLAEHFREFYEKQFAKRSEPVRSDLLQYFKTLDWHGNIRELANTMARHVLIGPERASGHAGGLAGVRKRTSSPVEGGVPLKLVANEAIREMERRAILEALQEHKWNRRRAAEALKISYRALIYKIRDAGLSSRGPASD
jgi:two-component system response regulator AtoC